MPEGKKNPEAELEDGVEEGGSCGVGSCGCGPFPADVLESDRWKPPYPHPQNQERIASGGLEDESPDNPVRNGPSPFRNLRSGRSD